MEAGAFTMLTVIADQGAFGGVAVAEGGVLEPDRLGSAFDAGDGEVAVGDDQSPVVGLSDLEVLNSH